MKNEKKREGNEFFAGYSWPVRDKMIFQKSENITDQLKRWLNYQVKQETTERKKKTKEKKKLWEKSIESTEGALPRAKQ